MRWEGGGRVANCRAVFFYLSGVMGGGGGLCNLLGGVGSAVALPGAMLPKLPKSKTPHSHRESCNRTVCLSQPLRKDFTKMPDIIFWHLYPWASQCYPRPNVIGADFWLRIFPLSPSLTGFCLSWHDPLPPLFLYPPSKCMWWWIFVSYLSGSINFAYVCGPHVVVSVSKIWIIASLTITWVPLSLVLGVQGSTNCGAPLYFIDPGRFPPEAENIMRDSKRGIWDPEKKSRSLTLFISFSKTLTSSLYIHFIYSTYISSEPGVSLE